MKHLTDYLWFETPKRRDLVNITDRLEELVKRSGVRDGFCLVSGIQKPEATRKLRVRPPSRRDLRYTAASMSKSIFLQTYDCQMNERDSEEVLGVLTTHTLFGVPAGEVSPVVMRRLEV